MIQVPVRGLRGFAAPTRPDPTGRATCKGFTSGRAGPGWNILVSLRGGAGRSGGGCGAGAGFTLLDQKPTLTYQYILTYII